MKQRFFIPFLLLIGTLLVACGSTSSANAGTTGSPTSGATQTAPSHFKVSDVVMVGATWKAVVNSVTTNTGENYNTPTKGIYVIVDITLTNISNKEQNISSFINFKMKGSDGTAYNEAFTSGLTGVSPAPDGKVETGGLSKGDFVYDIPVAVKSLVFSFSPDAFASGQTIWDLNL